MSGLSRSSIHSRVLPPAAPEAIRPGRVLGVLLLAAALLAPSLAGATHRRGAHETRGGDMFGYGGDEGAFARPGLYIGAGLTGGFTTRLEGELTKQPGVNDVEVDPSVGLAARVGARITPHLAIEAHYEWMADFETSVAGQEVIETTFSTLTGDLKGYLATGRIQPYLSLGAGFLSAESQDPGSSFQKTDTDFAARFGGGVDFYLNEHLGLSLDTSYVLPAGDVEELDYISVGAGVFVRF